MQNNAEFPQVNIISSQTNNFATKILMGLFLNSEEGETNHYSKQVTSHFHIPSPKFKFQTYCK